MDTTNDVESVKEDVESAIDNIGSESVFDGRDDAGGKKVYQCVNF